MKINLSLILTCFVLLFVQYSFSQAICGFDLMHARKMKEDAVYRKNVLSGEASIREFIKQHPAFRPSPTSLNPDNAAPGVAANAQIRTSGNPVVTLGNPTAHPLSALYNIPVVVQVIHTGGAVGSIYNPSDAQIQGAIGYLNAVYNGTYAGTQGAGDLQIQFVLAARDPNCNPTNGINRVNGSGIANYVSGGVNSSTTLGTADINVKNLSRWDPTQYYNIWIVDKIDGNDGTRGQFIAGYAYFPGSPASEDGIVMLATQMVSGQKTLPHEIGHAFNLYHPFQGSADVSICPTNGNCSTDGDQVCDTDPISENINSGTGVVDFTCRTGTNTCTGTAYSINTESNYMNYTNCYTLFTVGQKARMQASASGVFRASLSASLGGTPPGSGTTPCVPKIDFELTGDQETETTSAVTAGCRGYKDYSYNMIIGVAPSATAIATLSVSGGTGVQGEDFDITTNGNFSAPSLQLSFTAGATASQPFTIRVYDDAKVNGSRTGILSFTVNSGGGNAVAGDGRPQFTMTINDNDIAPYGPQTVSDSIGPDQGTIQSPFVGANAKNKSQILYFAAELNASGIKAGNINGLSLNIDKVSATGFNYTGMTIKMASTAQAMLYNGSTIFPLADGSFSTVYNSNYASTNGWNAFTFSTPFTWDGVSNIVIEMCYDNGAVTGSTDNCEGYVDGSGNTNYIFAPVNCGTAIGGFSFYSGGVKPMVKLVYADPGTTVQTALNSSQSQYLGPNDDVYFYDQTNGQLMARIQNLSSFNYGCTQVLIDRAGTNATQFWNNNAINYLMDKTFHVLPSVNNTSGSYNITLYYTQSEVNGWQAFTGQTISSIQLVKVPTQISNVTPGNPSGGGAVTLATPAISALGTNTGLTYHFTNGFSGFGAGVPGLSPLPIGLLNFTGRLEGSDAVLNWSTSFEAGNKGFEVQRSFDGNSFSQIGFVAGAGNSTVTRYYSFTDPSLSSDNNYYRLRQVDLDGKFIYSQVVLVNRNGAGSPGFTVVSNPFTNNLDILFGEAPIGQVRVRLLTIDGRELLRQAAFSSDGTRLHVDLIGTALSAGIYLLEVNFNNKSQTQKIIKK
jgi:Pregnancy-associated plasma protein-A